MKPWKLNVRTEKTCGAPDGRVRNFYTIHRHLNRTTKAPFSLIWRGGNASSFWKSSIMINICGLLKINFKVSNFLQVYKGLKLDLEKVQWEQWNYSWMRQTIYIKRKYKKYNTIYTVHNRDSLILSQLELKRGLLWKEDWGTVSST